MAESEEDISSVIIHESIYKQKTKDSALLSIATSLILLFTLTPNLTQLPDFEMPDPWPDLGLFSPTTSMTSSPTRHSVLYGEYGSDPREIRLLIPICDPFLWQIV